MEGQRLASCETVDRSITPPKSSLVEDSCPELLPTDHYNYRSASPIQQLSRGTRVPTVENGQQVRRR